MSQGAGIIENVEGDAETETRACAAVIAVLWLCRAGEVEEISLLAGSTAQAAHEQP